MWVLNILKWLFEAPFLLIGLIITYWKIAIVIIVIAIVLGVVILKRV